MSNPKEDTALRLEAQRDFNQERMFEALDVEDEILHEKLDELDWDRGWAEKLAELDENDDLPF